MMRKAVSLGYGKVGVIAGVVIGVVVAIGVEVGFNYKVHVIRHLSNPAALEDRAPEATRHSDDIV